MRSIGSAVRAAIADRRSVRATVDPVPDDLRIDGKVCLVTGANSGLGKAVATDLARRGGTVLMACRGGHPVAGEDVRRASGSENVRMLEVDLADLASVHRLCDELRGAVPEVDIAVLNAGLMPRRPSRSAQGYELMFAVHFLANRVLVDRLLADGVIQPSDTPGHAPRVVVVSSEAHRAADAIDFDRLGAFTPYGLSDGLRFYGLSKLVQCTYVHELSRRLNPQGSVRVAVHALCPGPIDSAIAREAPLWLKPLLTPVMKVFFASPERAAAPVIYLCCSAAAGQRTGLYLHMMQEKELAAEARDSHKGSRLWTASEALASRDAP